MKRNLSPDNDFKAGLLQKLNLTLDTAYSVKYSWYQTVWFKHTAGFASVILVASSLGTGTFAYTSPEVTEGTPLYPVKQQLENIEEQVQISPQAKAEFYLKKIERREEEKIFLETKISTTTFHQNRIEIAATGTPENDSEDESDSLVQKKIEKVNRSIEQTEDKLERAGKIIEKIQPQTQENMQLREQVRARLQIRSERIEREQVNTTTESDQLKEVKGIKFRHKSDKNRSKIDVATSSSPVSTVSASSTVDAAVSTTIRTRIEKRLRDLQDEVENLRDRFDFRK